MKSRITLFMLILIVVAALFYVYQARKKTEEGRIYAVNKMAASTPTNSLVASNKAATVATTSDQVDMVSEEANIARQYQQGLLDKLQAMLAIGFLKNKTPQDFYGKVVDQDGQPITNAKVDANLFLNHANDEGQDIEKHHVVTDENGLFEFVGIHGAGFSVKVSKEGFEIEGKNQTYKGPVGNKTSPADRAVYTLWRADIHEQLITGNKSFEIVPDGRPYFISLTDGTILEREGGDLKVWIQYTNQVVRGQLYDWSAGIEVINGGLLEVPQAAMNSGFSDVFAIPMYVAPTEGYVSSFSHKGQIKGGQSGEIGNRYFYLLLNSGREYGRMSINLFAPYGRLHPGLICISYAINPSGSRILR